MKKAIFLLTIITSLAFSTEVIATSSNNPQLQENLNKGSLPVVKTTKSTGSKFLENTFKNNARITNVAIREIYTKKIADTWTGGIFLVKLTLEDDSVINKKIKLFYNKELIVEEIYTEDGQPLSSFLSLPILDPVAIYNNNEFKIHTRDKTKPSIYGNNMVIFSDILCVHCKKSMPSLLKFAKKYNMNIFLLEIASPASPNSSTVTLLMNIAIEKEPDRALEIVEKTYKTVFPQKKAETDTLIEIFNLANRTQLTKEDLIKYNKKTEKLNKSENIARKEHITGTPTVFVDEERFNIDKAIKEME